MSEIMYAFGETTKTTEGKTVAVMESVDVIVIQDGATNGMMMHNTFLNVPINIFPSMNTVLFGNAEFDLDWWNAPYEIVR